MMTVGVATSLTVGAVIAAAIVGLLVALVRRGSVRSTTSGDLRNITVSRQWLMQHQSNDRS
jgi:uncharacterized protein (DUF2062 family)